jgi:hypothetical protein
VASDARYLKPHFGNDGCPFLLFIASNPPQAFVDFFSEINLKNGFGIQLNNELFEPLSVICNRLTWENGVNSQNLRECFGGGAFELT